MEVDVSGETTRVDEEEDVLFVWNHPSAVL